MGLFCGIPDQTHVFVAVIGRDQVCIVRLVHCLKLLAHGEPTQVLELELLVHADGLGDGAAFVFVI